MRKRKDFAFNSTSTLLLIGFVALSGNLRLLAQNTSAPVPAPATRPTTAASTQPVAPQTRPATPPATSAPAAAPAAGDSSKAPAGLLRVKGQRVNMRAKPDTSSLVVGKADTGMTLQATGKQYGWYQIVPPPGLFAYASARFINRQPDGTGTVAVESGNLRVRAGSTVFPTEDPEKNNDIIALLPAGATVHVLEQQGDWLKITPPEGVRFYIDGRYVTPIGEDLPDNGFAGAGPSAAGGAPTSAPAHTGSDWMKKLTAIETAITVEAAKDESAQSWDLIKQQLTQISKQTEDAEAARLAAADLQDVKQRSGAVAAATPAPQAGIPTSNEAPATSEGPTHLSAATPSSTNFTAVGQLEPAFALPNGPYGLRYKLIDPYSRSVNSYVEFPPEAEINATSFVGHYVGVRGDRRYLREAGVSIVTAYELTTISKEMAAKPAPKTP